MYLALYTVSHKLKLLLHILCSHFIGNFNTKDRNSPMECNSVPELYVDIEPTSLASVLVIKACSPSGSLIE